MIRLILLPLFSISYLFSLSSLPYNQLSQELLNAQTQFKSLQNIEELNMVGSRFSKETQETKKLAKEIMQDGNVDAKEAKKYLQKLRKLDSTYQGVLSITRGTLGSAIEQNNYQKFLTIVNSDLPKLFNKNSLRQDSVTYYKANSKKKKNAIMERELRSIKKARLAQKHKIAEEEATLKALQAQNNPPLPTHQDYISLPSNTTSLKALNASSLRSDKQNIREKAFTRWMSKREHQLRYDNGYYKKAGVYPAYVETDSQGRRRILEIKYKPKFYWSSTSGRLFKNFKKQHVRHTLNGKKLLFMHIKKMDGVKIYTATWITSEYFSRESAKLQLYGIYPPQ